MTVKIGLESLREMVEGLGDKCPVPANVPADAVPIVSLWVETNDLGYPVCAIGIDYLDAGANRLAQWHMGYYRVADTALAQRDGVTLADHWHLPIRRASALEGWEPIVGCWQPIE
jgi:hypothetical protein